MVPQSTDPLLCIDDEGRYKINAYAIEWKTFGKKERSETNSGLFYLSAYIPCTSTIPSKDTYSDLQTCPLSYSQISEATLYVMLTSLNV